MISLWELARASSLGIMDEPRHHRQAVWGVDVSGAGGNIGLNAATGKMEDLVKAGIIDPAKVVRIALQNAVSAATMIVTTECAITDLPEPKAAAGGDDHHHDH